MTHGIGTKPKLFTVGGITETGQPVAMAGRKFCPTVDYALLAGHDGANCVLVPLILA
jgi:hypothetical protein